MCLCVLMLLSFSSRKYGVRFHNHYSQVHYGPEWLYLLGFHLWVRIDPFENYFFWTGKLDIK